MLSNRIIFLLTLICLSACKEEQDNANTEATGNSQSVTSRSLTDTQAKNAERINLSGQLESIISFTADKACANNNQCKALAIGHKSCGGPEQYLVYSTLNVDENKLLKTADSYNQKRREAVENSGRMSTCVMLMPPALACQNNICVTINKTLLN